MVEAGIWSRKKAHWQTNRHGGEEERERNRNNCFSEGVSVRMGEPHCKWEEHGQSAEVTMM